jgi:hypothetical protein
MVNMIRLSGVWLPMLYVQLAYAFSHWAGKGWIDRYAQNVALKREAEKRDFRDARMPMYLRRIQVSAQREHGDARL